MPELLAREHSVCLSHIMEIADDYVKLDIRGLADHKDGLELIVKFSPEFANLGSEIKKYYDLHMQYCEACKTGTDKPVLDGYLVIMAWLVNCYYQSKSESSLVGDWFWNENGDEKK